MKPYAPHFQQLNTCLLDHAAYWRCQPFVETPGWWQEQPALAEALGNINDTRLRACQASDQALLDTWRPLLPALCQTLEDLTRLPRSVALASTEPPSGMPGRKWRQIQQFSQAIGRGDQPFVEWCAGKAHLGRQLYRQFQQDVLSLEIDPALVEQGRQLAAQDGAAVELQVCDVLRDDTRAYLEASRHPVALHACGGLHRKLLMDSAAARVKRISWSPCCYHKFLDGDYQPLSHVGRQSGLALTLKEIRGAVRQNSTAGRAERERHERRQRWRLGFDTLQRELRQCDEYLPSPPLPSHSLAGSFADFCGQLAALKQLSLPATVDYGHYERIGARRYAEVARQELVRELFRRPLELWLVLDQILFLEEHGYTCRLTQFCEAELTPRNLMIDARQ